MTMALATMATTVAVAWASDLVKQSNYKIGKVHRRHLTLMDLFLFFLGYHFLLSLFLTR
jgi:hypothetical protein